MESGKWTWPLHRVSPSRNRHRPPEFLSQLNKYKTGDDTAKGDGICFPFIFILFASISVFLELFCVNCSHQRTVQACANKTSPTHVLTFRHPQNILTFLECIVHLRRRSRVITWRRTKGRNVWAAWHGHWSRSSLYFRRMQIAMRVYCWCSRDWSGHFRAHVSYRNGSRCNVLVIV